jgi:hypothetical protein
MKLRHVDGFVVMIVLFLLVTAMFSHAQIGGSVAAPPANGPSYMPTSNPRHADQHDLATPQNLLGSNGVTEAHGERPLWEFGSDKVERPLGDVAREYRLYDGREKARIRWEQQGK